MITTLRVFIAGILVLTAACGGGGGGSEELPPAGPVAPGNDDTTAIEAYPSIKYLYFLGDDYANVTKAGDTPIVRSYQQASAGASVPIAANRAWPAELIRPKVAPSRSNMTYSYVVLKEQQGFWRMFPDQALIERLTTFNSQSCEDQKLDPATTSSEILAKQAFFNSHRTFFYGVTRANAGVYTYTAGPDAICDTGDDEFWELALDASNVQAAKPVAKEIAMGQELLDADLNLLGFIYASPGETVKTYDKDSRQVGDLGSVDGYVVLNKHYNGNSSVLVIGRNLYLVNNLDVVKPGFSLPAPAYTASAPISEQNLRVDTDRVYLIDGLRLIGVSYDGSAGLDQNFAGAYSSLSFGNATVVHNQVFTKSSVIVLAEATANSKHLLAVSKQGTGYSNLSVATANVDSDGNNTVTSCGDTGSHYSVADEYLATDDHVYGSYTDVTKSKPQDGFKAIVWKDDAGVFPWSHCRDYARWYFYTDHGQGGSKNWALMMLSAPSESIDAVNENGFFTSPIVYRYDPQSPDAQGVTFARLIGLVKIRELASAQSGHLLFTTENDRATKDLMDIFYYNPEKPLALAPKLSTTVGGGLSAICERAITDSKPSATSPPCGL